MTHDHRCRWLFTGLAVFLLVPAFGCGGDSGGSCGEVQPCGGNIRGTWKVDDSCLNPTALMGQVAPLVGNLCPTAKIRDATLNATGSYTFNADMTYATMSSTSGQVKLDVPQSCLSGFSCTLATVAIQLQLTTNPIAGVQSVSCAGTADCVCTIMLEPLTANEGGTYVIAGSQVTTTPGTAGATASTRDYCVAGSSLHFMTVDPMMMGGTATSRPPITADIVAKKQ